MTRDGNNYSYHLRAVEEDAENGCDSAIAASPV